MGPMLKNNGNGGISWQVMLGIIGLISSVMFGAWNLNQAELTNLKERIIELQNKQDQFTSLKEFNQFEKRILDDGDIIRKQLNVLEQTRPTTGELQAIGNAVKDRLLIIENRLDQLSSSHALGAPR